jgi:hypothetical protein
MGLRKPILKSCANAHPGAQEFPVPCDCERRSPRTPPPGLVKRMNVLASRSSKIRTTDCFAALNKGNEMQPKRSSLRSSA